MPNIRSCYIERRTIEKLRRVIGARRWLPLRISLETGLRIGDVVALRYTNVYRQKGRPVIRARAQKTGKIGVFPITAGLYKQITGSPHHRTDFIFPSRSKTGHLTRQAAWARMKSAAADLGIEADGISPHSLRKCFAVALMHTEGLEAVKKALQHTNDAVTRVYAYADTVLNFDSDAPIRWCDLAMLTEYIISVLNEKQKGT